MKVYSSHDRRGRENIKCQPTSRKICGCGCKGKATHVGMAQGAAMMFGCELVVRRWVRDGP